MEDPHLRLLPHHQHQHPRNPALVAPHPRPTRVQHHPSLKARWQRQQSPEGRQVRPRQMRQPQLQRRRHQEVTAVRSVVVVEAMVDLATHHLQLPV